MTKLIRFFLLITLLFIGALCAGWYYVTNKVAAELNAAYAGKQITVKDFAQKEHIITFKEVSPTGFPYKLAWNIIGWQEEDKNTYIEYKNPISFGYNLLTQKIFASYDGHIIASFKPKQHGFGSRLEVSNYIITIDLPLTSQLINELKQEDKLIALINNCKDMTAYSDHVQFFDLVDNEKYYDKEFEKVTLNFKPAKKYANIEDFLNNIPQQYNLNYQIKTNKVTAVKRRKPTSIFYGFILMPSDMNFKLDATLNTKGQTFQEYAKELDVSASGSGQIDHLNIEKLNINYSLNGDTLNPKSSIKQDVKFRIQPGFFEKMIASYENTKEKSKTLAANPFITQELDYIVKHKDDFRFNELENNNYELNLDVISRTSGKVLYSKLNNFSLFSENSGIKLAQDLEYKFSNKHWNTKGVLYLKNYQNIVDFSSAYIYRFGKYRPLSDAARKIYVETNTSFLKAISDHPSSVSDDLSFEYEIDSRNIMASKFGSASISKLWTLYSVTMYQKLIDKVGVGGDVLGKIRKIMPSIDGNEPILKNILPKISTDTKIQETVEKVVPLKRLETKLLDKLRK